VPQGRTHDTRLDCRRKTYAPGTISGRARRRSAVDLRWPRTAALEPSARHAWIRSSSQRPPRRAGHEHRRQIGLALGVPVDRPAFTVNMMCASGLQAVILAAQAIASGQADVVLCGGTESMSQCAYVLERARTGYRMGDVRWSTACSAHGLVDPSSGQHMALSAERLRALPHRSRRAGRFCPPQPAAHARRGGRGPVPRRNRAAQGTGCGRASAAGHHPGETGAAEAGVPVRRTVTAGTPRASTTERRCWWCATSARRRATVARPGHDRPHAAVGCDPAWRASARSTPPGALRAPSTPASDF